MVGNDQRDFPWLPEDLKFGLQKVKAQSLDVTRSIALESGAKSVVDMRC